MISGLSKDFDFGLTIIDLKTQSGLTNNAAVLTKNRFLMADIGNEDGACRNDVFTGKSIAGCFRVISQ